MRTPIRGREQRNILLFYLLTAFTSFSFISSNWIYFWTKYMTFGQLGIVDGVAFGFALLLDVPTGAIADLFGRRKTIIFAFLASSIGTLMIASANSLHTIFIGWMIAQLGFAFYSGSAEALTYDTLIQRGEEDRYVKIISRNQVILLIVTAIAALGGGFLYMINERIPQYLWALGYIFGFIASWFLIEPKMVRVKFSLQNYLQQLFMGVRELLTPKLRKYFLFFFILLGIYYLYAWGFIRPAMATSFGFYAKEQGMLYASLTLISAILISQIPNIRKQIHDFIGLTVLTSLVASGFILAFFPIGKWGIFSLLAITLGGEAAYPWISAIINKQIPSQYRATTLSTISLLAKIPYVLFAIVAGNAIQNGQLNNFSLGVGVALLICIVVCLIFSSTTQFHKVHSLK